MIEDIEKSRIAEDSSPEAPDVTTNREESNVLPFAPNSNGEEDGVEAYDRPVALPHFQAFLAFVDEYLGKQVKLYERLGDGKEQYVAFENLWMLFDANDTIYCPLREVGAEEGYSNMEGSDHTPVQRHTPQAYRVVATSGGMPSAKALAPAFKMKEADSITAPVSFSSSIMEAGAKAGVKAITDILTQTVKISRRIRNNYTEFNLYCFYVDFNGVEYGTVREVFVFKPYERDMEIRSLQAYPAIYAANNSLHERGDKFLDATKISHLQYEGLTVGPNREEASNTLRHFLRFVVYLTWRIIDQ
jgi:hypothetical protein